MVMGMPGEPEWLSTVNRQTQNSGGKSQRGHQPVEGTKGRWQYVSTYFLLLLFLEESNYIWAGFFMYQWFGDMHLIYEQIIERFERLLNFGTVRVSYLACVFSSFFDCILKFTKLAVWHIMIKYEVDEIRQIYLQKDIENV